VPNATSGPASGELGSFLRARREQLRDAGALRDASSSRRRTPGARRSEIAALASISVEWYTRLEQGRGGNPSHLVLAAVCDALQLHPADREHAFRLAYGTTEVLHESLDPDERARLQRLVDRFDPLPAYVKSPSWDVLVWNASAADLLSDYGSLPPHERNILRILFLREESRSQVEDWHAAAALTVATFRAELARWGGQPAAATALIDELISASEYFRALWGRNEVGRLGEGAQIFRGSADKTRVMRYESLSLDAYRGLGLVLYTPVDA
jgi:transcriptional regulator with XRE-family HTH domain